MTENKFWRITLDTNPDFCNLNCVMCEDHSPYSVGRSERKDRGLLRPIMPRSMLEKLIREAAAMGIREVIPSTMGEPLLYPYFDNLLDLCHELKLSLNLTTNGTFPGPQKDQNVEYWAKKIVPIGSDVKLSWNGATDATQSGIMIGSSLKQHIENARRFIAVRNELSATNYCSVTMQMTFMRSNLEEIPEMLELALDLGFDRIKGHQLWAHFPELVKQSLRNDIDFAKRWNEVVQHCIDRVNRYNQSSNRPFKLDNFFELSIDNLKDIAINGECPFLEREIWIDPTGRFNVCCAPDQQRKALGNFGNISSSNLQQIATSSEYKNLVATYRKHPLCQSCNMRRPI